MYECRENIGGQARNPRTEIFSTSPLLDIGSNVEINRIKRNQLSTLSLVC